MPTRNHFGAERVVRPEMPRVHATVNTTPFASVLMVMVVLLSLSMAPTQQGLDVGLPVVAPASLDAYTRQVVVEITADRAIALNNTTVTLAELENRLREVFARRRDQTVYVIGAGSLRYGDIVPLIDAAYGAGANRVGIVTERMLEISRRCASEWRTGPLGPSASGERRERSDEQQSGGRLRNDCGVAVECQRGDSAADRLRPCSRSPSPRT